MKLRIIREYNICTKVLWYDQIKITSNILNNKNTIKGIILVLCKDKL